MAIRRLSYFVRQLRIGIQRDDIANEGDLAQIAADDVITGPLIAAEAAG